MGDCQKTGCSLASEAVKPTPVSVLPETVRPVIAWMPGPDRPWPPGVVAFQVRPSDDVQTTTSWCPRVAPNEPVAVNMSPAAASAVTWATPDGTGSGVSVHVAPPSADRAANGASPLFCVCSLPYATTVRPAAVTCSSTAREAPDGTGREIPRHSRPSTETHAAGWSPKRPTAAKPLAVAVTASIP